MEPSPQGAVRGALRVSIPMGKRLPGGQLCRGLARRLVDVDPACAVVPGVPHRSQLPENLRQTRGVLRREPFQVVEGDEGTLLASMFDGDYLGQATLPLDHGTHSVRGPEANPTTARRGRSWHRQSFPLRDDIRRQQFARRARDSERERLGSRYRTAGDRSAVVSD
jgi:hypothetical protein